MSRNMGGNITRSEEAERKRKEKRRENGEKREETRKEERGKREERKAGVGFLLRLDPFL